MQELRIVLIIIGIIAIAGLLIHGFMSNRRNKIERLVADTPKKATKKRAKTKVTEPEVDLEDSTPPAKPFDDLGVGEVRIVHGEEENQRVEPTIHFDESSDESLDEAVDEVPNVSGLPSDEQPAPISGSDHPSEESSTDDKTSSAEPSAPDDVYVLNVVAPGDSMFHGSTLLNTLNSLGLKFGEMNIYHRHQHANGQGPILFSLANMVKPGTFDADDMVHFQTPGVSLFMTVPCAGEPSRNFNVMYNAAERLVRDLDGVLLDGYRNPFTAQTLQHYQQRIREYERQLLLQPNN